MKAYSMDLRERVFSDSAAGMGTKAVAAKYQVSEAWVRRLKQRQRETGEIGPRQQRHGPRSSLVGCDAQLKELVRSGPDLTTAEFRDRLGLRVSVTTVWRALRRLGFTFKKSPPGRRARSAGCRGAAAGMAGRGDGGARSR